MPPDFIFIFLLFLCFCVSAFEGSICGLPGDPCSQPRGGVCTINSAKLSCECPDSHTVVRHNDERICQTKLLDIYCQRDNDFACLMVKDSVCTPNEARCVCPPDFVYVPHRHKCKVRYSGNHHYCKVCESEQGICFQEDELTESNGPIISDRGVSFRLSCACSGNKGIPNLGKTDSWTAPVCSTRLRDIEEECNEKNLICRSKRAKCRKPRNVETDFKKCLCPDRYVAVYQPWLKYYECFEKLDIKAKGCEECGKAEPYGICYSVNNSSSETGCLCPKRISTPEIIGGQSKRFCTKHHVSVTCKPDRMEIRFDPKYDSAPYNQLSDRLRKGLSVAFVEGNQESQKECQLAESKDGVYAVSLETDSDAVCGRRTIRKRVYEKRLVLTAVLKVLWNKNFYSYPDIVVDLECRVDAEGLRNQPNGQIRPRKPLPGIPNRQPPRGLSGVHVSLRVLNKADRMVTEVDEGELIKLDIMLDDNEGRYSSILIQQCLVTNKTFHSFTTESVQFTKLISCGGVPNHDSGFTASFKGSQASGSENHLQTQLFPAFRLGKVSFLYFSCTIRICKESEIKFCNMEMCNKMAKRSPDDGIRELDKEVHIVVNKEHLAKRAENYSICQYSMCLSTSQVIIIILILLVLLALVSGLIIVVYRRRLFIAAHKLRLRSAASMDDDTPTDTPVDSMHKSPLPAMTALYAPPNSETMDSAFGGSMRTYASMTLDRCPDHRQHQDLQACLMTSALLGSRPDVCTCDRPLHRSYSVTSSQV